MAYRNRSTKQGRDMWNELIRGSHNPQVLTQGQTAELYYHLSGAPVIGDLIRWRDNWNSGSDYLKANGMTWDDVQYPSRLPGAGDTWRTASTILSKSARFLYR